MRQSVSCILGIAITNVLSCFVHFRCETHCFYNFATCLNSPTIHCLLICSYSEVLPLRNNILKKLMSDFLKTKQPAMKNVRSVKGNSSNWMNDQTLCLFE